jgi:hypothetical protein
MREAQQHFGCAASSDPNSYMENPQEVRSHSLLGVGIPVPTGIGSVWRSLPAMAFASKKSVRAAEQDLQRDDGQEDDHDKGDCRSIKVFPIGVDTHRSTPLCGSCKTNKPSCRRSNRVPAMREAQQYPGPLPPPNLVQDRHGTVSITGQLSDPDTVHHLRIEKRAGG